MQVHVEARDDRIGVLHVPRVWWRSAVARRGVDHLSRLCRPLPHPDGLLGRARRDDDAVASSASRDRTVCRRLLALAVSSHLVISLGFQRFNGLFIYFCDI